MKRHYQVAFSLLLVPFLFSADSAERYEPLAGLAAQAAEPSIRRASVEESGYLVSVRGSGFCSGAPIAGTNLVITAAHCVVEPGTDAVGARYDLRVERSGVRYEVLEVYVDMSWKDGVRPQDDVAVLVMESPIPGPGLHLADSFEPDQSATLVGFQPSGKGTWLRGSDYDSHSEMMSTSYANHATAPAACSIPATSFRWSKNDHWWVPCGMVPGASGGPLIAAGVDGPTLVGVTSSVDFKLESNGVAPVEKVQYLLRHRELYRKVPGIAAPCCTSGNQR